MSDISHTATKRMTDITHGVIQPQYNFNFSLLDRQDINVANTGGLQYPDQLAIWTVLNFVLGSGN